MGWPDQYNMTFASRFPITADEAKAITGRLDRDCSGWTPDHLEQAIRNIGDSGRFDDARPPIHVLAREVKSVMGADGAAEFCECKLCARAKGPSGWIDIRVQGKANPVAVPCVCGKGEQVSEMVYQDPGERDHWNKQARAYLGRRSGTKPVQEWVPA